jgi:hypothetical protein
MARFDLFVHGPVTELTGEWRHVGNFKAPLSGVPEVARLYMQETGAARVRVFTGSLTSTIGRLVFDSAEVAR